MALRVATFLKLDNIVRPNTSKNFNKRKVCVNVCQWFVQEQTVGGRRFGVDAYLTRVLWPQQFKCNAMGSFKFDIFAEMDMTSDV